MILSDLRSADGASLAGLADITGELDMQAGQVDEVIITVTSGWGELQAAGLTSVGTALDWADLRLRVAGHGWAYPSGERWLVARSALASALRGHVRPGAEVHTSPSSWVARRCSQQGGSALAQPSASRERVLQIGGARRQSDLDVIETLCEQLGWSWSECGGVLRFGSRRWAWETAAPIEMAVSDLLDADLRADSGDLANAAAGSLTVAAEMGSDLRVWDVLELPGAGVDGPWLVDQVQWSVDGRSPVRVGVSVPRPDGPRDGSVS